MIAKVFPMGEFHFVMIGSLLLEPILAKRRFSYSWSAVSKWLLGKQKKWPPAVFWDRFLATRAVKMAALWRIFAGWWVSSPQEHINRVLMHFYGLLKIVLWCFHSTAISLELINIVMWGTTVFTRLLKDWVVEQDISSSNLTYSTNLLSSLWKITLFQV